MGDNHYQERIEQLAEKIEELERQLAEELVTHDFSLIDPDDRLRIRMFTDDDKTARLEFYDEQGNPGVKVQMTTDGHGHFGVRYGCNSSIEFSVKEGHPGTVRVIHFAQEGMPHKEAIIGESEDMMVGIQINIDMTEKIFVGVDNSGEAKIRLTQSDGTVNEITPSKP